MAVAQFQNLSKRIQSHNRVSLESSLAIVAASIKIVSGQLGLEYILQALKNLHRQLLESVDEDNYLAQRLDWRY